LEGVVLPNRNTLDNKAILEVIIFMADGFCKSVRPSFGEKCDPFRSWKEHVYCDTPIV
jgi:hypothetical protein